LLYLPVVVVRAGDGGPAIGLTTALAWPEVLRAGGPDRGFCTSMAMGSMSLIDNIAGRNFRIGYLAMIV